MQPCSRRTVEEERPGPAQSRTLMSMKPPAVVLMNVPFLKEAVYQRGDEARSTIVPLDAARATERSRAGNLMIGLVSNAIR